MKLMCLSLLVFSSTAFVNFSKAITSEEIVAKLECVEYCHRTFHRSCLRTPAGCGKCILSYHDRDGVCLRKHEGREVGMYEAIDPNNDFRRVDGRNTDFLRTVKKLVVGGSAEYGDPVGKGSIGIQRKFEDHYWDVIIIAILCSVSVVLLIAIILTIVCVCRSKNNKLNNEMPYQTFYGTTLKGPANPAANGDRKLAYSAQMYHYQYQKQQMLANEKANGFDQKNPSGNSTDDEVVDDDDTVYECPGLANTEGEMEVTNPYFVDMAQDKQQAQKP